MELAILVAVGPSGAHQSWALELPSYRVGRPDGTHDPDRISVVGDPLLSRHHFDLHWSDGRARVVKHPRGKNAIFFQGQEQEEFELSPGQSFRSGKTRFELRCKDGSVVPTTEFTFARTELHQESNLECFRAVLELLPGLRDCSDAASAWTSTLALLKKVLPRAAELKGLRLEGEEPRVEVVCGSTLTPASRSLLRRAVEQRGTVTYVWDRQLCDSALTLGAEADWAVASLVTVADKEQYALYALGTAEAALGPQEVARQEQYLDEMAALVDVVAQTLGHHLTVQRLNRLEGQVGQFFSPALRERLTGPGLERALAPTRREVTVLFFDLRGFSRATERAEDLAGVLEHHEVLTEVMTAVTDCVFEHHGVVVDYQGDAVMACWGALSDEPECDQAAAAARMIVERLASMDLPFGDQSSRCGLGLALGEAVVGQVGAREQIKFGVLGAVVNLASRLEGLTKHFGVPILINGALREQLSDGMLCRRIGRVRPAGMSDIVEVHEMVLPAEVGGSGLDQEAVWSSQEASRMLEQGDMEGAYGVLLCGAPRDPVGRFLTRRTLAYLDGGLPPEWDGVIEFHSK